MEFRNVICVLGALRQTEEIVGLLAVVFGFEVFVTEATSRNDYPNGFTLYADEEAPLA